MEEDFIDDVLDELPLASSKHYSPHSSERLSQVYPNKHQVNKHQVNGDPRGRHCSDDLHTGSLYGVSATPFSRSHREDKLSDLDSDRFPKRRDSLNSNSTEFLMNELSHHLQLQASQARDEDLSILTQDPSGNQRLLQLLSFDSRAASIAHLLLL